VPPHLPPTDDRPTEQPAKPGLTWGVRFALLFLVAVIGALFSIALLEKMDPYGADGVARKDGTHEQLGLPPCTFKSLTGKLCPSCGMSTSFALLMRGDVINSYRANAVGTLLAVFLLLCIPWALISLMGNRLVYIASLERALTWAVAIFLTLLLVRWAIVLLL
jgi:Protein of unknown function (DUF2752)